MNFNRYASIVEMSVGDGRGEERVREILNEETSIAHIKSRNAEEFD